MKKLLYSSFIFISIFALSSCEDVIELKVQDGVEQLVVDGWLTSKYEDQIIKLTLSQGYFDNSDPKPATRANVIVFEEDSTSHVLLEIDNSGEYLLPKEETGFLKENGQYALYIEYEGEAYAAVSKLNRVPPIDSLSYEYFEFPFAPDDSAATEGYFAEFYANEPAGEGDTYWIRTKKNGELINDPTLISIAYDAGFTPGSGTDGLIFILPVRQSINDGLYVHGDSIHVELWSTTPDAYYYLLQVRQESSNGGIFATPPANIPTNIFNLNSASEKKAIGFFGVSGVSMFDAVIDSTKARISD